MDNSGSREVGLDVSGQMPIGSKCAATLSASIGFFACVQTPMDFQVGTLGECSVTDWANVWLQPSVNALVLGKITFS